MTPENDTTVQAEHVVEIESVTPFRIVGERIRPLLSGDFEVFEARGPKDTGPPPHVHPWSEGYVVLEGEMLVRRGDVEVPVPAGSAIHIPGMTIHCYRVTTASARWIVITAPVAATDFFADLDATTEGAMDLEKIKATGERHSLTLML